VNKIYIIYYPVSDAPNIDGIYYHEFFVPWKCMEYIFPKHIEFIGINIRQGESLRGRDLMDNLVVVSADFSHFLPFQEAIMLENKASHSLMFRDLRKSSYMDIVDDVKSFQELYSYIPSKFSLQWVGRLRSPGMKGVGYLSFLLMDQSKIKKRLSSGLFVTVYDENMNQRECLGEWYSHYKPSIEKSLIRKVIKYGSTTSRLSDGQFLDVPLKYYTVTYLFKEKTKRFLRGYHGIKQDSFYLPDVFLENTFQNGQWIQSDDKQWVQLNNKRWKIFSLKETKKKLNQKFKKWKTKRKSRREQYQLYSSRVKHKTIS